MEGTTKCVVAGVLLQRRQEQQHLQRQSAMPTTSSLKLLLLEHALTHAQVVLAYGAESDRKLNIPGEVCVWGGGMRGERG